MFVIITTAKITAAAIPPEIGDRVRSETTLLNTPYFAADYFSHTSLTTRTTSLNINK